LSTLALGKDYSPPYIKELYIVQKEAPRGRSFTGFCIDWLLGFKYASFLSFFCGWEESLFNKSAFHIVEFRWQEVTVTVSKHELKVVLDKLDTVKLELLRLRAMLLPEEEASEEEKREIEAARKEIAKGSKTKLDDLVKELC
jgi:hypothetical protein